MFSTYFHISLRYQIYSEVKDRKESHPYSSHSFFNISWDWIHWKKLKTSGKLVIAIYWSVCDYVSSVSRLLSTSTSSCFVYIFMHLIVCTNKIKQILIIQTKFTRVLFAVYFMSIRLFNYDYSIISNLCVFYVTYFWF